MSQTETHFGKLRKVEFQLENQIDALNFEMELLKK
jgi:hypothetical protein